MDQSSPGVVAIRADGNEHKIILVIIRVLIFYIYVS